MPTSDLVARLTEEGQRLTKDIEWSSDREHDLGCPTVADDDSDYAHLADAGVCGCGAHFHNAAREIIPKLVAVLLASCEEPAKAEDPRRLPNLPGPPWCPSCGHHWRGHAIVCVGCESDDPCGLWPKITAEWPEHGKEGGK